MRDDNRLFLKRVNHNPALVDSAFAHTVWRHFVNESGVVLRLWECSGTLAGLRTAALVERCVRHELEGTRQTPASLLRWDVPAALYAGGRTLMASDAEAARNPSRRGDVCGCSGERVASTMLGWVFLNVPAARRGWASAHDAWTFTPTPCEDGSGTLARRRTHSAYSSAYAAARLQHFGGAGGGHPAHAKSQLIRCPHSNWNAMLRDMHAYTMAVHLKRHDPNRTASPRCGFGGLQLYNQVGVRWRREDIRGIFYVNDTYTAPRARVGPRERQRLLSSALRAAERSYRAAQIALSRAGPVMQHLPVLQYRVTADCTDASATLHRVRAHADGQAILNDVFLPPPPRGRETPISPSLAGDASAEARGDDVRAPCGVRLTCGCAGGEKPNGLEPNACGAPRLPFEHMLQPGTWSENVVGNSWWNAPFREAGPLSADAVPGAKPTAATPSGQVKVETKALSAAEQPNHGSPLSCNSVLLQWLKQHLSGLQRDMHVLDVGGGTGEIGRQTTRTLATADARRVHWRVLDVEAAAPGVERFDGRTLPVAANAVDVVLFNWVFHHAGDATIGLIQEAKRVVRAGGRIVIVEDLRGDNAAMRHHQDTQHPGCPDGCLFRKAEEWHALFRLLGLTVVSRGTPARDCLWFYTIPRALFELSKGGGVISVS